MRTAMISATLAAMIFGVACGSSDERRPAPRSESASTSGGEASAADEPDEEPIPPQSFAEAMQVICVDAFAAAAGASSPQERASLMAQHIADNLRNGRVVNEFLVLPELSPDERRARIIALAEEAGLSECPTAQPDMEEPPPDAPASVDAPVPVDEVE